MSKVGIFDLSTDFLFEVIFLLVIDFFVDFRLKDFLPTALLLLFFVSIDFLSDFFAFRAVDLFLAAFFAAALKSSVNCPL
jgi:hypothetical protein